MVTNDQQAFLTSLTVTFDPEIFNLLIILSFNFTAASFSPNIKVTMSIALLHWSEIPRLRFMFEYQDIDCFKPPEKCLTNLIFL